MNWAGRIPTWVSHGLFPPAAPSLRVDAGRQVGDHRDCDRRKVSQGPSRLPWRGVHDTCRHMCIRGREGEMEREKERAGGRDHRQRHGEGAREQDRVGRNTVENVGRWGRPLLCRREGPVGRQLCRSLCSRVGRDDGDSQCTQPSCGTRSPQMLLPAPHCTPVPTKPHTVGLRSVGKHRQEFV